MLDQNQKERIAKIVTLVGQIGELEEQIVMLMEGVSEPRQASGGGAVTETKPTPAAGEGRTCCGSMGYRHKKGCSEIGKPKEVTEISWTCRDCGETTTEKVRRIDAQCPACKGVHLEYHD